VNEKYRKDYIKGRCEFVECTLCGQRFNAGRVGTEGMGPVWNHSLKNEWWAKHTGQESHEVFHVLNDVELCPMLKEPRTETEP